MGADERTTLEDEIAATVREQFPELQVYDVELTGGRQSGVTVYIDRPGGVDLQTCAAVSAALEGIRERHALQVSSPGLERRLRRPEHFEAAVGCAAVVRTVAAREGRKTFRGTVRTPTTDGVTLALDEGPDVHIAYDDIARANLVYRFDSNGDHRE